MCNILQKTDTSQLKSILNCEYYVIQCRHDDKIKSTFIMTYIRISTVCEKLNNFQNAAVSKIGQPIHTKTTEGINLCFNLLDLYNYHVNM